MGLSTRLENDGLDAEGLYSGYVLWAEGGFVTGLSGVEGANELVEALARDADWSAAYDQDWMVGLLSDDFTHVHYEGRAHYRLHDLKAGAVADFSSRMVIGATGSTRPMAAAQAQRDGEALDVVRLSVQDDAGAVVPTPAAVVRRGERVLFWEIGSQGVVDVPRVPGTTVQAVAAGFGASPARPIGDADADAFVLPSPGQIDVAVALDGVPAHARIDIVEGEVSPVAFLGARRFFTDLDAPGRASFALAPGAYTLGISHGSPFVAPPQTVSVTVASRGALALAEDLTSVVEHGRGGFYSADLHHHANIMSGNTSPRELVISSLASGLDFVQLSDLDTTVNLREVADLARAAGAPFIASVEIAPSWGHFNPMPIPVDAPFDFDPTGATVTEILDYAASLGAMTSQANHPNQNFGYFTGMDAGTLPGGHDDRVTLFEVTSRYEYASTITCVRERWNEGLRVYLSAGSDNHDVVWADSGDVRLFVHLSDDIAPKAYVASAMAGRSVVSFGPMIYPQGGVLFGDKVAPATELSVVARSAMGLERVDVMVDGDVVQTWEATDATEVLASITVPEGASWVAWSVWDAEGHEAHSNPLWVVTP